MKRFLFLVLSLFCLPTLSISAPYYGANFSYAVIGKEPPTAHGFQIMLTYDPDCLRWRRLVLYFDAGFSHFWITNTPYYSTLNIYSIAPVARYMLNRAGLILPFFEISVGLSYLNHTHLDNRNLGIHFAFQDRVGFGLFLGPTENFTVGIHAVHYSNARLSSHNSGVTFPLVLDIGYRFN